jgi:histone H3/H4
MQTGTDQITTTVLRRMCRKGNIKRTSKELFELIREELREWFKRILSLTLERLKVEGKNEIVPDDVIYALKKSEYPVT